MYLLISVAHRERSITGCHAPLAFAGVLPGTGINFRCPPLMSSLGGRHGATAGLPRAKASAQISVRHPGRGGRDGDEAEGGRGGEQPVPRQDPHGIAERDRKSTRLNSSHPSI